METRINCLRVELVPACYLSNVNRGLHLGGQHYQITLFHDVSKRPNLADVIVYCLYFCVRVGGCHCCEQFRTISHLANIHGQMIPSNEYLVFLQKLLLKLAMLASAY